MLTTEKGFVVGWMGGYKDGQSCYDIDRTVVNKTVLSNFEVTALKIRFVIAHPYMDG